MANQTLGKSPSVSRVPLRVGSWPGPSFSHNSVIPILCAALQRRGTVVDVLHPWRTRPKEIDILQIHWPEQVFWSGGSRLKKLARVGLTLAALARLRCFGVRVVWMVHNTQPHDPSGLILATWRFYVLGLKMLTQQYIVLSPATEVVVRQRLRLSHKAIVASIRHPSYPRGFSTEVARLHLGISPDLRVYVFFGMIRPYKGIDDLLDAFGKLADPNARLIIAGEPHSPSVANMLSAKAKLDPRIDLRTRKHPRKYAYGNHRRCRPSCSSIQGLLAFRLADKSLVAGQGDDHSGNAFRSQPKGRTRRAVGTALPGAPHGGAPKYKRQATGGSRHERL